MQRAKRQPFGCRYFLYYGILFYFLLSFTVAR